MIWKRGSVVMPHVFATQSYSGALKNLRGSLTSKLTSDAGTRNQDFALSNVNFNNTEETSFQLISGKRET